MRGINDITVNSNGDQYGGSDSEYNSTEGVDTKTISSLLPSTIRRSDASSANTRKGSVEASILMQEMKEILTNPHYMLATAGLVANNFALGIATCCLSPETASSDDLTSYLFQEALRSGWRPIC